MKTTFTKIISSLAILGTMLTAQAAWEITSSGSTFEVSDGDWILQCQKSGSEGNFKISKVIQSGEGKLDLIALNSDIDDGQTDYSLIEINTSLRNQTINGITIPKTVKTIGGYSFQSNATPQKYLTGDVVIEEGSELTSIGKQAFQNSLITSINLNVCTKLESLGDLSLASSTLTTLGTEVLPETLTYLGGGVFNGCANLAQDIICYGKLSLGGTESFKKSAITRVILPNIYGHVGDRAFESTTNLTEVILSSSITGFGVNCFSGSNIEKLIPSEYPNVTNLGSGAFSSAQKLTTALDFSKCTFTTMNSTFKHTNLIPEIKFPATLTSFSAYTFEKVKDCDYYFYGPPPTVDNADGIFKQNNSKERCNFLVTPQYVNSYTNGTVNAYVFTPLSEIPEAEKTPEYQYPENVRVIGKINIGINPSATHWLSLMPIKGLSISVH
jgi:hypothetical protein